MRVIASIGLGYSVRDIASIGLGCSVRDIASIGLGYSVRDIASSRPAATSTSCLACRHSSCDVLTAVRAMATRDWCSASSDSTCK